MIKVLVANRGEIACRVIRSCRQMGFGTVAVYSDADANALHVHSADEAWQIGPAKASESYLKADMLLQIAAKSGADGIHPGYGFLSENEDFAAAVEAADLVWIGPRPQQIAAMGDKEKARRLAVEAGVPVLPGSKRFAPGDLDGIEAAAEAVGFPLLVKACGGGGGIGMRVAAGPGEVRSVAEATQRLAERSFGDGTIFLERYVREARHIEVQVFGDGRGNAIHLFERDCSVQRRFQKIVEESPAPGLSTATRERMTAAAEALARAVDYRSAGTIEFVVDAATEEFFFLEMNTRIQVEHPVTEAVTGVDLVELQLSLAFDDAFQLPQPPIARGHAIEVRLCAENPARMFLPAPGHLSRLTFPDGIAGLRIDTGVRAGDTITPHYDSMIAKLILHAPDRQQAIDGLRHALTQIELGEFVSNREFLAKVMDHPAFRSGRVRTSFIDVYRSDLI